MKDVVKISVLLLAALALTACNKAKTNNNANTSSTEKNSSLKIKKVAKIGHLSAKDLSPQKTVSAIVTYAGKKYPEQWEEVLKNAERNGLQVNLKNQAHFSYMQEGSGVAYMLSDDVGYTLKQVNNENQIYLFANKKKLESVMMSKIIDYLNHHNGERVVNSLTANAKINDERNSNTTNSASAQNNQSNLAGDAGLFDVPAELQGTWYAYPDGSDEMSILKISSHSINDGEGTTELHKMKNEFLDKMDPTKLPKSYQKATENWGRTSMIDKKVRNISWMNVSGWLQTAGDGEFYGSYTEEGQPVIISAHGAGIWADTVYWKTPALAKQYKGKKFKGLGWQD